MKSIKDRFNDIKSSCPIASDYTCFYFAIKGQDIGVQTIRRWFNKLVPKEDYGDGEKEETVRYLITVSQGV